MRKLSVYLDTSVISYLQQEDAPDRMNDTLLLWEDIKAGKYSIFISDVTIAEIYDCSEPKRSFMFSQLNDIEYISILENDESKRISNLYLGIGGLPPKSKDDATHIAIATVNNCDIILSWNFKHIVNYRAMTAVRTINAKEHYKIVDIMSPSSLIEREE